DTAETIDVLCEKAVIGQHHVAAVCVYPAFVKQAKNRLGDQTIRIATVVNFPHGTDSLESVLTSIRQAMSDGADEIDVVFPYQNYLHGEKESSYDFIRA